MQIASACMYVCMDELMDVLVFITTDGKWLKGYGGQTCDQACRGQRLVCDANRQSELTSNAAVAAAFNEVSYVCKSFHPPRSYGGTPFSTGRDADDCAPLIPGTKSVCDKNTSGRSSGLCYCRGWCVYMYACMYHVCIHACMFLCTRI